MFDEELTCIGVIGDGCGGGRVFTVHDDKLKVYDPQSKEFMVLLEDIKDALFVSKKGCIVTVECKNERIEFDLSAMKRL